MSCLIGASPTDMMSEEEQKNITYFYNSFMENEKKGWTNLDDYLEILEWLDNAQICRECNELYSIHKTKKMGCPHIHEKGSICFVTRFLEAVEAILELHKNKKELHIKNRYLLCHYLALCHDKQIVELPE